MQKRVSAGQRINGNISASAMNELGKMIQERNAAKLSRGGQAIELAAGPGLFIQASNSVPATMERGEWMAISGTTFDVTDREDRWPFETEAKAAYLTTTSIVLPVFAMAMEKVPNGRVGVFQIAGIARTKIFAPPSASAKTLITAFYDDDAAGTNPRMLTGSEHPMGSIDVIWHDTYTANASEYVPVWAMVRWPGAPRQSCRPFQASGPMGEGGLPANEINVAWQDQQGGSGVAFDRWGEYAALDSPMKGHATFIDGKMEIMGINNCDGYTVS
ncbi:hypothetical protein DTL21_08000 [Bremerella cremea]|uniref:Uncharacterized protein n=1 Tax=Blastopirellula marina TaxID=124 RepID=A0A2S8FUL5_9BACT|nr:MULTISPECIES: hypothetical protein [Pirellulaceae]PQO35869.1 hypothetical protein C5Y83_07995 [Blastopirellula marina]RCS48546.1 hypothetical protein DTL21_08000 [Bremerella cremea]